METIETMLFTSTVLWRGCKFYPIGEGETAPIVCCTKNGKIVTFKQIRDKRDWDWKVDKYAIVCWCYQYQLCPL